MKWYVCTPVAFRGDRSFFERDSGQWCRALRACGIESRAVMPLPAGEDDVEGELLRAPYRDLESANWWRSLGLDGVILYSWGLPRYTPVARAIKEAGLKLIVYLDSNGDMFPWRRWREGALLMRHSLVHRYGPWAGTAALALKLGYAHTIKPFSYNWRHRVHLDLADLIGLPMPHALNVYAGMSLYGRLAGRLALMPAPVGSEFCRNGAEKEDLVVCIGRWDDTFAKRPRLMADCLEQVLKQAPSVHVAICGNGTPFLRAWLDSLPADRRARVAWKGYVSHEALPELLNRARISLCTSRSESTHLVSEEALCCGCSVVAPGHYGLEALAWYASENSGTIASSDAAGALTSAVLTEREHWESGRRDADRIAEVWGDRLHAEATLPRILGRLGFSLAPRPGLG